MYIRVLAGSNFDQHTACSVWGICWFIPVTSANCSDGVSCRVRPKPFRSFPRCVTTVSSEFMDVEIRDGSERIPSCSGYSSSAERLVWTSLERGKFLPFWVINFNKFIGCVATSRETLKNFTRNLQFISRRNSQI